VVFPPAKILGDDRRLFSMRYVAVGSGTNPRQSEKRTLASVDSADAIRNGEWPVRHRIAVIGASIDKSTI